MGVCRTVVAKTECGKSANKKRQRHLLHEHKRRLCLYLYGLYPSKEKGAFELSLKDAVAFMSANSTVDFVVCQQEFVGKIVFSKVQFLDSGLWCVTVQTGCSRRSLTAQSIHLREKSIAGPTERPKGFSLFGSQGSDQRFSMKMVFAPYPKSCQPV